MTRNPYKTPTANVLKGDEREEARVTQFRRGLAIVGGVAGGLYGYLDYLFSLRPRYESMCAGIGQPFPCSEAMSMLPYTWISSLIAGLVFGALVAAVLTPAYRRFLARRA